MDTETLTKVAQQMVADGKGILAMDESTGTITKRLKAAGIEPTDANAEAYRSWLAAAEGLGDYIGGAILAEPTLFQQNGAIVKKLNEQGILPGIKVDKGTVERINGEHNTRGNDDMEERLVKYREAGAAFAKWRAVFEISDSTPSTVAINANADGLAKYARFCQEAGIVPIVEPEILMNGSHDIEKSFEVSTLVLKTVFERLEAYGIYYPGMILKPGMVISGEDCSDQASVADVAGRTLECLKAQVPSEVTGIAFLSGGQSDKVATLHLNEMNKSSDLPWRVTFSYGRALVAEALNTWKGEEAQVADAQAKLLARAKGNSGASKGELADDFDY